MTQSFRQRQEPARSASLCTETIANMRNSVGALLANSKSIAVNAGSLRNFARLSRVESTFLDWAAAEHFEQAHTFVATIRERRNCAPSHVVVAIPCEREQSVTRHLARIARQNAQRQQTTSARLVLESANARPLQERRIASVPVDEIPCEAASMPLPRIAL